MTLARTPAISKIGGLARGVEFEQVGMFSDDRLPRRGQKPLVPVASKSSMPGALAPLGLGRFPNKAKEQNRSFGETCSNHNRAKFA